MQGDFPCTHDEFNCLATHHLYLFFSQLLQGSHAVPVVPAYFSIIPFETLTSVSPPIVLAIDSFVMAVNEKCRVPSHGVMITEMPFVLDKLTLCCL